MVTLVTTAPFVGLLAIFIMSQAPGPQLGLLVLLGAGAVALALLLAWLVSRRIIGPIHALASAARSVARPGSYEPIPEAGPQEVAETARAFNFMLSQRSAADSALLEAEERYRSLVEGIPGIVYLDGLGTVSQTYYISPQVESILGYTPEDYLANASLWLDRLHPADRERAVQGVAEQERTGEAMTIEYRMLARDGRVVWLRDRSSLIRDADGTPRNVLGIMVDITAEREIAGELARETADRQQVAHALSQIEGGLSPEATAASIVAAVSSHFQTEFAAVIRFTGPERAEVLADRSPAGPSDSVRLLQPHSAGYLAERASGGTWVEPVEAGGLDDQWVAMGLRLLACAPLSTADGAIGVLVAGSTSPSATVERLARRLPALAEFAAVATKLLAPQLGAIRGQESRRKALRDVISRGELHTVFQPVIRLADGSAVGYEALTRFTDGEPPVQRFAAATALGVVHELEGACMRSALAASGELPTERWVSLNLSPAALIADPSLLTRLADAGRVTVVEITEQVEVGDYGTLRRVLGRRPKSVELAVDDAGAGFASLRHILELGPRYVKLDMALVRGIASDPARQALIAGMVHFAGAVGCSLVAEGVETEAERATLIGLGVPFAQGFLFGKPAEASAFARDAA
jgi:PAS domain S-box-containing protein